MVQRRGENHTKTDVFVEVIWVVPVTVSAAGVVSIVVPRTAAQHASSADAPFTTGIMPERVSRPGSDRF